MAKTAPNARLRSNLSRDSEIFAGSRRAFLGLFWSARRQISRQNSSLAASSSEALARFQASKAKPVCPRVDIRGSGKNNSRFCRFPYRRKSNSFCDSLQNLALLVDLGLNLGFLEKTRLHAAGRKLFLATVRRY